MARMNQIICQNTDLLVTRTKCVYGNKLDESFIIVRNKVRLVVHGFNQEQE